MSESHRALSPSIHLGDKIVKVHPPTHDGMSELIDRIAAANLPLPAIATETVRSIFDESTEAMMRAGDDPSLIALAQRDANVRLYGAIIQIVSDNLPTLQQWFFKHPPIIRAFVVAGTNLTAEEVGELSAGSFMRVARECLSELKADGFFEEALGFFFDALAGVINRGSADQSSESEASDGPAENSAASTSSSN